MAHKINTPGRPSCCGRPMIIHGHPMSGRNKRIQFICPKCGITKLNKEEGK